MSSILARSAAVRIALAGTAALAVALPALADDIDVYRAQFAGGQKPNILFVLDYSGSMNQDVHGDKASESGLPRKIDILRDAMAEVLTANAGRIRAGVSQYATEVSGVRWPISDLDVDAHEIDPAIPAGALSAREAIGRQLDRRDAGGWTRTVNALAEAAMYFRGGTVAHGGDDPLWSPRHRPDRWDSASGSYAGGNASAAIEASYTPRPAYLENVFEAGSYDYCNDYSPSGGTDHCSGHVVYDCETREADSDDEHLRCKHEHPDRWAGADYVSPITQSCQANAIVLISDGLPNSTSDNATLQEVAGTDLAGCEDVSTSIFGAPSDATDPNGNCGPEIVRALAGDPQVPSVPDSTVRTYTVGFSVESSGQDYLRLLAREGKGEFFAADQPEGLVEALSAIVDDVVGGTESFVELSVDVDRASFSHDDRAFLSLFRPSTRNAWQGNLKGYFVDGSGRLLDINGKEAVLDGTAGARFAPDAQSFWSPEPDGDELELGGASAKLATLSRKLYTYLGDLDAMPVTGVALAGAADHRLATDNSAITDAHLGLPDGSPLRASALDWLQTAPMGDPLHSKSISVDYGDRQVVYVMTNQGLLHAIDASAPTATGDSTGGDEIFAFMPKRLLENLPRLLSELRGGDHVYGLDGAITRWHVDGDDDGVVDAGESVMLVLGMRRGGEAYYALDVTDPDSPRLAWAIDSSMPDFAELAQSWSRASLVRVKRDAGESEALAFGGGYDAERLDDEDKRRESRGNAIFVVDREGDLIRKFGKSDHGDMKYAFAADPTIIDSDSDGLADRIYAVDVGGQVWRIDFDNIDDAAGYSVARLADLDGGGRQPFFSAPSVALNRGADGDFLSIAIGSGDRTDPLATDTSNAFFMLRDKDVEKGAPASGFETIKRGDLYDASANLFGSADADVAEMARKGLAEASGWRVDLAAGEKSLSRIVSFEGMLIATTFQPDATNSDPCDFRSTGRYYLMDLATARPFALGDEGGTDRDTTDFSSNPAHRSRELEGSGIPSRPLPLFTADKVVVVVGRETVGELRPNPTRVYWHSR